MSYRYLTADVFTDQLFGGNQLAVIPEATGLSDEQMLSIAREFNYSETVFVLPPRDPSCDHRLRIFTPGGELPFAGHPTIGAAFILTVTGQIPHGEEETRVVLEEGAGPVTVVIRPRSAGPFHARLTAPKLPEFNDITPPPAVLARALNLTEADLLPDGPPPRFASCGLPYLCLPLRSLDAVRRARTDRSAWLSALSGAPASEVYLFSFETESPATQIHARMFAPAFGIEEDPATGSAVAALGAFLADHDPRTDTSLAWNVEQGIELGRPSLLRVEVDKSRGAISAVHVAGSAVLVMQGELCY